MARNLGCLGYLTIAIESCTLEAVHDSPFTRVAVNAIICSAVEDLRTHRFSSHANISFDSAPYIATFDHEQLECRAGEGWVLLLSVVLSDPQSNEQLLLEANNIFIHESSDIDIKPYYLYIPGASESSGSLSVSIDYITNHQSFVNIITLATANKEPWHLYNLASLIKSSVIDAEMEPIEEEMLACIKQACINWSHDNLTKAVLKFTKYNTAPDAIDIHQVLVISKAYLITLLQNVPTALIPNAELIDKQFQMFTRGVLMHSMDWSSFLALLKAQSIWFIQMAYIFTTLLRNFKGLEFAELLLLRDYFLQYDHKLSGEMLTAELPGLLQV